MTLHYVKMIDHYVQAKNRVGLFDLNVRLEGIGVSIISRDVKELMYISAKELEFNYCDTNLDCIYALGLKWIQVRSFFKSTV